MVEWDTGTINVILLFGSAFLITVGTITGNALTRLTVGITDLCVGIWSIQDPEWAISELGGKTLPYYFEDQYDG